MNIDLKADSRTIQDFIRQRVRDYPDYDNHGPGENDGPIYQITLGFQISQAGWVALVFDTRRDGWSDGQWQSYIEENWLEFPDWLEATEAFDESGETIELIPPNGKKRELGEDENLVNIIGEMLKDILIQARKEKLLPKLPIAKTCVMGVEDHDGGYGWPDYENIHVLGRVL
jgi:hypothetical protein